ncbi:MAG TPA: YlmC/YmxH family sporulation protein, partial [Tissierellaceae bacterium]|nr:YlmC/YmxH family sporulation protein [Tissierellaceae bacterium]
MKEVINIYNGERLGYIYDFEISLERGIVTAMVMPGDGKGLSFFSKPVDIIIQWEDIVSIGEDIILIDFKDE